MKKLLLFTLLFGLFSGFVNLSFAQLPSPDNDILNQIPEPVSNFINSIQKIGTDSTYKSTWLKFNELSPRGFFNKIDDWFYGVTGTRLVDILKPVGNLLAWIFSTLAELIRWGLSFL